MSGEDVVYKARLVARGFSQIYGVVYLETFAPVVRISVIRLIIAIASMENWGCHQMDVSAAYLHGELDEEVYMIQPPFHPVGEKHEVCCHESYACTSCDTTAGLYCK